jgi:hypothetical protein
MKSTAGRFGRLRRMRERVRGEKWRVCGGSRKKRARRTSRILSRRARTGMRIIIMGTTDIITGMGTDTDTICMC